MSEREPRDTCTRCFRPQALCYCKHVVELTTKTRVVILQHPRERHVPVNTARIASLCLPEAELHVGVDWNDSPTLRRVLGDPSRPAALLYPDEGARDIEADPPAGPITLIVVDGTWWQARKVVRSNPALAALPRFAFRPPSPSRYRIRAEPREECLSTIEALVHVLGVLEGDRTRFEAMLAPFLAMVEQQVSFAATGHGRMRTRTRRPRARFLADRFTNLVCVHGEANAWPYNTVERATLGDELVLWAAHRVATGETLEHVVVPQGKLAPNTLRHLELHEGDIAQASARGDVFRAWASFLRPDDVVCSWGTFATRLFEHAGGTVGGERFDLRQAARMHAGGRVGTMASFLERAGEPITPIANVRGRSAARLGELVSIARVLAR